MNRVIETERLVLRPLVKDDAKDVFEWVSDKIVNKYLPYSLYENVEQVEKWIESLVLEDNDFAFSLKETGKVIGSGGIYFNSADRTYDLGYNLNRLYWGKGYATEAAKAMINWAYNMLNARDFTSSHATANFASERVIKKCGFKFKRFGQYSRFDGSETFDAKFYTMHLD